MTGSDCLLPLEEGLFLTVYCHVMERTLQEDTHNDSHGDCTLEGKPDGEGKRAF